MPTQLTPPPIREEAFQDDPSDGDRVEYVNKLWHSQDIALAARDRQIEENVRMLAGQQWIIWNGRFNRFVDVKEVLTNDERRYKQRPVVNRLTQWFVLNHGRMTENPPIIGFEPATADSIDSELAAGMDVLSKSLWRDLGMIDVRNDLEAWRLVGGRAYLYHQVDPHKGDAKEFTGTATLPGVDTQTGAEEDFVLTDPETGEPFQIPFNRNENDEFVPQINVGEDGEIEMGEAWKEFEGGLTVSVLGPLEVRSEWGHNIPFHEKSWHMRRSYVTVEQVEDTFGVKLNPDPSIEIDSAGQLERLLRASGHFGATRENILENAESTALGDPIGLVRIDELWVKPGAHGTPPQSDDDPGGRLLIVASGPGNGTVLRDGTRPAAYKYTSPMRAFDMVEIPSSPHGRSPLEWLNPIQRLYNRTWAQILEHTNLVANPIMVTDAAANIPTVTNRPGARYNVIRRPGVPAIEFVAPPRLSDDVYRQLELLQREFIDLSGIAGAEGRPPQKKDSSGVLVQELRFNSDRILGAPLRASAEEFGRFWEDILETVKVIWDEDKLISWMGEDDILRTATIGPHLFSGKMNVKPDLESMLPESRSERQKRVTELWQAGAYGDPLTPEARIRFLEQARFPHMGRAVKPGGVNWETARYVMGLVAQGKPVEECPIYEWYDIAIWLAAADQYMSTPEFLRIDQHVQQQLAIFRQRLQRAMLTQQFDDGINQVKLTTRLEGAEQQMKLQAGIPQTDLAVQSVVQEELAPPTPEEGVKKTSATSNAGA
jgi:hypothetical protein